MKNGIRIILITIAIFLLPLVCFAADVSGIVTANDGVTPLANINVRAFSGQCHNGPLGDAMTGVSGNYTISGLAADTQVYVWADSQSAGTSYTREWFDGSSGTQECWDTMAVNVGQSDVDFFLDAAGSVTGTVTNATGQPIENMHVYASVHQPGNCDGQWLEGVNTDAAGVYRIDHIPAGDVVIRTCSECSSLNYVNESWNNAPNCIDATPISVTAGTLVSGYDFQLNPGGSISGYVYGPDGMTGIANASVNLYSDRCHNDHQYGLQTDENGYFEFMGLPLGAQYILRADSGNPEHYYVGQWYDNIDDTQDCNGAVFVTVGDTISFDMKLGGYITGKITDSADNPIQGLGVETFMNRCWDHWVEWRTSDGDGNYRIGPLPPGDYFLHACPGCVGLPYLNAWWRQSSVEYDCNNSEPITVNVAQVTANTNFSVHTPSSISGTLTGFNGAPLPGVTVEAFHDCYGNWAGSATTDENGDYTIGGLIPGAYLLKISGTYHDGVQYPETWLNADTCDASTRVHLGTEQHLTDTDVVVEPGFEVQLSIMNVHGPEGVFQTYVDFYFPDFQGAIPDDILSVTVTLKEPDGSETVVASYSDADGNLDYYPEWNNFFVALPGSPALGYYEARVATAYATETVADIQMNLHTLPVPETISMVPADGATVTSSTPVFSWDPVVMDDPDAPPLFYRLEIRNMSGTRAWASGREAGMTSCAVPLDKLTLGETYQWRVRVTDSADWIEVQNRANSELLTFTMADTLSHGAPPALDLDQWGVATWSSNGNWGLDIDVEVIDQDGVAYDGSSHTVIVRTPLGDEATLDFSWAKGIRGHYSLWADDYNHPGVYTFTVTDAAGHTAIIEDDWQINPLINPSADDSISPSNMDEYITAWFDNVRVNGSPYDDFSTYDDIWSLDPNKWSSPGDCGDIVDGALQMAVAGTVGRGHCGLSVADPASVDTIQADITVTDVSSNDAPRARIRGMYYFNGYGDVSGIINVQGNQVYYTVSEEYFANGIYSWTDLDRNALMTVSPGQTVRVSIAWDGITLTFSATDPSVPGPVHTASYSATGLVAPPILGRELNLQTRTNLVVDDTTPTFSWGPATDATGGLPTRYCLRIYSGDGTRTIWRGYTADTSYTVPPGVLQPDAYYRFRIQYYDGHTWLDNDNAGRTDGDHFRFYTDSVETDDPYLEFDYHGVFTWNGDSTDPYIYFWVKVHDAQGVPGNIKSVKVQFPGNGQIIELAHDTSRDPSPTSGYYENEALVNPTGMDGDYTFIVEDWDGNVYPTTEYLQVEVISYPDPATFNATVTGTALDVDWGDVPGAAVYRLELFDEDLNRIHTFATTDSHYYVPAGILKANAAYRYRITTRREFLEQNVDNGSSSPWDKFDMPVFVTFDIDGDGDGDVDGSDLAALVRKLQDGSIGNGAEAAGQFAQRFGQLQ